MRHVDNKKLLKNQTRDIQVICNRKKIKKIKNQTCEIQVTFNEKKIKLTKLLLSE